MKIMRKLGIQILFILVCSFLSCDFPERDENSDADVVAPTITVTAPVNNAEEVALNSAVSATFSEAMDAETINESTFTLAGSSPVSGFVSYSGTTATFASDSDLDENTLYTATITSSVRDKAGNGMASGHTWSFRTGTAPDTTAPYIVATSPENSAEDAAINTTITVGFSEAMDPETLTALSFYVKDAVKNDVPGNVSYSGYTATFTPDEYLDYESEYTATVTVDALDLAGNSIETEYSWGFTTGVMPDTTAPVAGNTGTLNTADVTVSSLRLTWTAAADETTREENLLYRVYISQSDNIDTIQNIETHGSALNEYTASLTEITVSSLVPDTPYYFNVIVMDEAGNKAAYENMQESTLPDEAGPTPGTAIYSTNVEDTSLTVSWGAAADNVTSQGDLSYKLVTAATPQEIDTAAEADAISGEGVVMDWSVNTLSFDLSGLTKDAMYYFAVLVKDEYENMSLYTPRGLTTFIARWARTTVYNHESLVYRSVTVDSGGNIYAAGSFDGRDSYDFGNDVTADSTSVTGDCLLVKYDASGSAQWAQTAVTVIPGIGSGNTEFFGVTTDSSGNVYAVGTLTGTSTYDFGNGVTVTVGDDTYFQTNVLLVKYNSSGLAQWAKTVYSGPDESLFNSVAVDGNGNIYAAGYVYDTGTYNFGNSVAGSGPYIGYNLMLVKYNASGVPQWARSASSGSEPSKFYAVTVDSAGNVYAAGFITGTVAFNFGNGVTASCPDSYGNYAVLVKYNASGLAQWARTVSTYSRFYSLCMDTTGNLYASGSYDSMVLVKYNSSGTEQWTKFPGMYPSEFSSVTPDNNGNVYAAGCIYGDNMVNFGNNIAVTGKYSSDNTIVLVKYNSSGIAQCAKTLISGPGSSKFLSVCSDTLGNVYGAGYINGRGMYDFGDGATINAATNYTGIGNILLVKYR